MRFIKNFQGEKKIITTVFKYSMEIQCLPRTHNEMCFKTTVLQHNRILYRADQKI